MKPIVVKKPYLTGAIYDSTVMKSALLIMGSLFVTAVLYLIVCGMMIFDSLILRILLNGLIVAVTLAMFFYSGMSNGSIAVNQGEIMFHRRETGAEITPAELSRCFHPLKGFLIGLIGSIPLLLCALILAFMARLQTTGLGALPTWVHSLTPREEVGLALSYYSIPAPIGLEGIVRLIVRMCIMPFVNMVGSGNASGLLLLERLSPLVVLFPALAYGFGYSRGVTVRTRVHSDIAMNAQRRRKKARKAKRKAAEPKGPEALN